MGNPHTLAVGESRCHHCDKPVAVKVNRGGFAYYLCGRCGFEGRHHTKRASDEYLAKVERYEPAGDPEVGPDDPDPQPKPAKPATPPKALPVPPKQPDPAPTSKPAGWKTLLG